MDMRTAIKPKKIIPSILHLRPLEITLQSVIRHLQLAICNVAALSTSIMATFLFGQPNFLLSLLGQLQSNSSKLQPKQTCNQMQSKRTKFRVSRVFRVFRLYSFFSSRFFCWPKNVAANQIACRPKSAYESALERDNASTNMWGRLGG